ARRQLRRRGRRVGRPHAGRDGAGGHGRWQRARRQPQGLARHVEGGDHPGRRRGAGRRLVSRMRRWVMRRRKALTVFQLLVVLAVLLILLGFLTVALYRVRLVSEQSKLSNNLKHLGLALHNYNDTYGVLPPGVDDNHFSAAARLLPFVEEVELYRKID